MTLEQRVTILRDAGHQNDEIAAILGFDWDLLEAHLTDPVGNALPEPVLEASALTLTANGGTTVLSVDATNHLTKDGTAVTVP